MREQSRRCGDERNAVPQTQKFGMVHDKAHRLCESRHARACDEKEVGSAHRCDRRSLASRKGSRAVSQRGFVGGRSS